MSQWTHVNASIRIDDLRVFNGGNPPDVGNSVSYESDSDAWDKCDIPCGSEGSLQYNVWEDPSESVMAAYTVNIWGDLRDYDDVDEIIAYLNRITKGRLIRSGIAEIDVEFKPVIILRHSDDAGGWEKLKNN